MTTKILLIGRHGNAPQRPQGGSFDELLQEALINIYENVGIPLKQAISDAGIKKENSFLTHSHTQRVLYSGQAVFIGAFDMQPKEGENPPKTKEDLAKYNFSDIEITKDPRLNIISPGFSLPAYKNAGNNATPNINYGLQNPEATTHDGVVVDTYTYVSSRPIGCIRDSIEKLVLKDKELGVIVTHAGYVEPGIIHLINSSRKAPIEKIEDIGGVLDMGEFAKLTLEKQNGLYAPVMELKGQKYKIDLNKI